MMILSALIGFLGPFVPEVFKFFNRRQDNKHEMAMMDLRLKQGASEHLWRMEEIGARADIEESKALRRPMKSFGVQILDKADEATGIWRFSLNVVFLLFSILDWLTGMVRPTVTYAMVGFYLFYKWARLELMQHVSDESFSWYEGVVQLWEPQDWNVLVLVLSYWFGQRVARWAFGKAEGAR